MIRQLLAEEEDENELPKARRWKRPNRRWPMTNY
jgi:hypothetical protein